MSGNGLIQLRRISDCTFAQTLLLRQRGFEGYREEMAQYFPELGRKRLTPSTTLTMEQMLGNMVRSDIRPELSVAAFVDEAPAGFVFIALREVSGRRLAWNGGTGVSPEYRGRGLASAMMREASAIIATQAVDLAILEVLTGNARAIAAYERGGFAIADKMASMETDGDWEGFAASDARDSAGWTVESTAPGEVGALDFYREEVAWGNGWSSFSPGEATIVRDPEGRTAGYALFRRAHKQMEQGRAAAKTTLHQCVVHPRHAANTLAYRVLLAAVFGAGGQQGTGATSNLSMASPPLIGLLREAGFTTQYEQYLMVMKGGGNR